MHTEVVDAGTEEHRRLFAGQKCCQIKRRARALNQFHIIAQMCHFVRKQLIQSRVVQALDQLGLRTYFFFARRKAQHAIIQQVIHAAEALAHADRPRDGRTVDLQYRLDFFQQFDGLAHLAIHFVHESDNGRIAQAAYVQQLDGLHLHALGRVDHHHGRIHRRQYAIGILGKIFVARRIQQIDGMAGVVELHHRTGHRNAALFFHFHPIGSGMTRALARLHRARHLNRAAEQQQLFRERGLARIRVGDDGESAAFGHIAQQVRRERRISHG